MPLEMISARRPLERTSRRINSAGKVSERLGKSELVCTAAQSTGVFAQQHPQSAFPGQSAIQRPHAR